LTLQRLGTYHIRTAASPKKDNVHETLNLIGPAFANSHPIFYPVLVDLVCTTAGRSPRSLDIGDKAKRMSEPSITGGPLKVGAFDCRIGFSGRRSKLRVL
jgi:hypothetical protein